MEDEFLSGRSVPELRKIAAQLEIFGRSKLRTRGDLLRALQPFAIPRPIEPVVCPRIEYSEPLPKHILALLHEIREVICTIGLRFVLPQYRALFVRDAAEQYETLLFRHPDGRERELLLNSGAVDRIWMADADRPWPFAHLWGVELVFQYPYSYLPGAAALFGGEPGLLRWIDGAAAELRRRFGRRFGVITTDHYEVSGSGRACFGLSRAA